PPDFGPLRADLEPMVEPHELRKSKLVHTMTLTEHADWKLVMENARECDHCRAGHPQLMRSFRDFTVKDTSCVTPDWEIAFNQNCAAKGLTPGAITARWYEIGRYALGDGLFSYTLDGKPAVNKPLGRVGDRD